MYIVVICITSFFLTYIYFEECYMVGNTFTSNFPRNNQRTHKSKKCAFRITFACHSLPMQCSTFAAITEFFFLICKKVFILSHVEKICL